MATKNFTQFNTATPLTTSDYIVGYKADGTAEIKTQVQSILNLKSDSDAQTLSFNEGNKNLTISSGNTVSLSSLSDTAFANVSSSFATNTNLNAVSSLLTPLTLTNTLTGQLVTNTSFNNYQTSVANSTATLLPITTYQNASGSFASTNFVQTNFLPLIGGTISGAIRINNDLTVNGNISASGTTTFANTVFSTTSALSVVHIGSGPAMWVGNNGTGDIASFYDIDQNVEILHVGGNNGTFPNVGVKTSSPNKTLTVAGEISATQDITNTGKIFTTGGNSDQWNSTFTTFNTVSAPNIQVFASSGNWTKPARAVRAQVILIGGGGGGGSGRSAGTTVTRTGGGGGGGGAYQTTILDAGLLPNTVSVTIGLGGIGAGGVITANGNPGNPGGSTSFGTFSVAGGGSGGPGGIASAILGGAGGTVSGLGAGVAGGAGGGCGISSASPGVQGTDTVASAPGGGGGGPVSSGNARGRGGDGGICSTNGLARAAGGLTTDPTPGSGGAGASVASTVRISGQGGGGGSGQTATAGGAGGNGGTWGAGGGGGGAGTDTSGQPSGAGGNGADGFAAIITYFI